MRKEYEATLSKLAIYLVSPRTALEIANRFSCSRMTAYARVTGLRQTFKVISSWKREGPRGPRSKAWRVVEPKT